MTASDTILARLLGLHPRLINLSLDRLWRLLEKLGNPQDHLPPVIHIAGTNGKGSTLAFLQAILEAAGLSVHRYSSPHLVRFHERITLSGRFIDEARLSLLLAEVEDIQAGEAITFFEITTAAAMLAYSRTPADVLLLETGLGGRDDATNIVKKPLMTLLSSISLDHTEFLGDTLDRIARIKVAIGRPDVPMICADQPTAAITVIARYCHDHRIPLYRENRDWHYRITDTGFVWSNHAQQLSLPTPALFGEYQYANAALATTAVVHLGSSLLRENPPRLDQHIAKGIACAQWPGRLQKLTEGRLVELLPHNVQLWLDGGHNPDAARALIATLQSLEDARLIIGMLNSKDCHTFLRTLEPCLIHAQSVCIPGNNASHTAQEIADIVHQHCPDAHFTPASSLPQAINNAVNSGGKNILVCGSLYLVGEALHQNQG